MIIGLYNKKERKRIYGKIIFRKKNCIFLKINEEIKKFELGWNQWVMFYMKKEANKPLGFAAWL